MDNPNIQKWIEVFRTTFERSDIPADQYSDTEMLAIAKGVMAPTLCDQLKISHQWIFELYWQALLATKPDASLFDDVDFSVFKNRADKNKN